jgi:hypothetical protein
MLLGPSGPTLYSKKNILKLSSGVSILYFLNRILSSQLYKSISIPNNKGRKVSVVGLSVPLCSRVYVWAFFPGFVQSNTAHLNTYVTYVMQSLIRINIYIHALPFLISTSYHIDRKGSIYCGGDEGCAAVGLAERGEGGLETSLALLVVRSRSSNRVYHKLQSTPRLRQ